jgi:hypothetical protein
VLTFDVIQEASEAVVLVFLVTEYVRLPAARASPHVST